MNSPVLFFFVLFLEFIVIGRYLEKKRWIVSGIYFRDSFKVSEVSYLHRVFHHRVSVGFFSNGSRRRASMTPYVTWTETGRLLPSNLVFVFFCFFKEKRNATLPGYFLPGLVSHAAPTSIRRTSKVDACRRMWTASKFMTDLPSCSLFFFLLFLFPLFRSFFFCSFLAFGTRFALVFFVPFWTTVSPYLAGVTELSVDGSTFDWIENPIAVTEFCTLFSLNEDDWFRDGSLK